MEERRRNKRTDMPSKLVIKRMDDNSSQDVAIDIVDVSKTGIGFNCKEQIGRAHV